MGQTDSRQTPIWAQPNPTVHTATTESSLSLSIPPPLRLLISSSSSQIPSLAQAMLPRGVTSAIVRAAFQSPISNYSISDQSLESRGFLLRRTISGLNLDHLNSVFVSVGFPRRDPEKIKLALEHTDSLLWVEHKKSEKPVAFARATGDGVFNAIIWDVVVDPNFQGIGLGKAVMERLVDDLVLKGISNIALYSEPRVLGFYKPLGFVVDPDGIRGMVYSRKQRKKK